MSIGTHKYWKLEIGVATGDYFDIREVDFYDYNGNEILSSELADTIGNFNPSYPSSNMYDDTTSYGRINVPVSPGIIIWEFTNPVEIFSFEIYWGYLPTTDNLLIEFFYSDDNVNWIKTESFYQSSLIDYDIIFYNMDLGSGIGNKIYSSNFVFIPGLFTEYYFTPRYIDPNISKPKISYNGKTDNLQLPEGFYNMPRIDLGQIYGNVMAETDTDPVPVKRKLHFFNQETGDYIGETESDEGSGSYLFPPKINKNVKIKAVVFEEPGGTLFGDTHIDLNPK